MKREEELYLQDIKDSAHKIINYTDKHTFESFLKSPEIVDAILHNLAVIGEASNKLSQEAKNKYSKIPWFEIVGMRNVIVHTYFEISYETLWKTAKEDIVILLKNLE